MLDPTIQGGGTIRYPAPQNAMMHLRKSPMDMNTSRYEKLVQVPSRGPKGPAPTMLQLNSANQHIGKSTKTTVTDVDTNFAGKPKPISGDGCDSRGGRNRRYYK